MCTAAAACRRQLPQTQLIKNFDVFLLRWQTIQRSLKNVAPLGGLLELKSFISQAFEDLTAYTSS